MPLSQSSRREPGNPGRLQRTLLVAILAIVAGTPACKNKTHPAPEPHTGPQATTAPPETGLKVSAVRMFGVGGERPDHVFARGESLDIRCLLQGIKARDRFVHLKASLRVTGPQNLLILQRPERTLVKQAVPKGRSTHLMETALRIHLSPASPPGDYRAEVRFLDVLTGERGQADVTFRVAGPPLPPGTTFAIHRLHAPPDLDLRAGLPLFLDFEVVHPTVRKQTGTGPGWHLALDGRAEILDGSGVVRGTAKRKLLSAELPFRARQVPVRWGIPLPRDLPTGEYLLRLTAVDRLSGRTAKAEHRFKLLPGGLGLYGVRLSGAGQVPRTSFGRGEQVNVDLILAGFASPAKVDLGVGLVGPDQGFYLVRKHAYRLRQDPGTAEKRLRIPLLIPEFAPRGRWTLKLRAQDHTGRAEATRDVTFNVTGRALRPLPTLRIQHLTIRWARGGPPLPGLFLRAGRNYQLDFVVGGAHLKKEQGYYYRVSLTCTLRLRDRQGKLVATKKDACDVARRFSFQPRRLRLKTSWTLPPNVLGLHQLEVEVLDRQSDRVSMLQRRVFVVVPR